MKQVDFRQKKNVQPRQSVQKSLIGTQRAKRVETDQKFRGRIYRKKRGKRGRAR
ncbi:MAG: hypothetical protein V3U69_01165 [Bacteroidota bacterium]